MSGKRKWLKLDAVRTPLVSAVVLMCVLVVGSAQADLAPLPIESDPIRVESQTNLAMESAFTLDFGEFGDIDGLGPLRTGVISATDMELSIDPDIGFARFTRYDQDVAPLILPGGFDTGNIRVLLVRGSSSGTFNPLTGVFVTNEEYAIYFEGDLSAFGLESPVILASSSTGVLSFDDVTLGSVSLEWNGESTIGSGEFAVPFTYTCVVNNQFVPGAESLLAFKLGPEVLNLELPDAWETGLFNLIEKARDALRRHRTFSAESYLLRFVEAVERGVRAHVIDPTDGANLIFDAEFTIDLILDMAPPREVPKRR